MRYLTTLSLLLATTVVVQAASLKHTVAKVFTNHYVSLGVLELSVGLDWRTTVQCSNVGTCREANPALIALGAVPGTIDGTRRFTAVKGLEMLGIGLGDWYVNHRWPEQSKTFALEKWALAGAQGVIDYHNHSLLPKVVR
jgi:hypothetical protein